MMGRYPEVEAFLTDYSGLDIQSIGRQAFERATESRLGQASHGSYNDYLAVLRLEEAERTRLLDLIVVPETWFFRDTGTFAYLTAFLKTEWGARADRKILRILCAPCATGEEPYSIAMTLLETGLDPSQFRIHAADISPRALAAAKAAHYRPASFRTPLTAVQARFFDRGDEWSTVCESVQGLVGFSQGNLVDPNFMTGSEETFDVIFCKNLMIYLAAAGRAKVIANLGRLLKESGLLFVGHSEVALFQKAGYTPVSPARAFGLTKARRLPEAAPRQSRRGTPSTRTREGSAPRNRPAVVERVSRWREPVQIKTVESLLAKARSLADRGDLQEAASLCRSLIGANSMDVGAYYLAGLIEQSQNRLDTAEELFLKAIYLDPDHYDTLVQLCLLSEKKGKSAMARQYRKRLQRLEANGKRG